MSDGDLSPQHAASLTHIPLLQPHLPHSNMEMAGEGDVVSVRCEATLPGRCNVQSQEQHDRPTLGNISYFVFYFFLAIDIILT